MTSHAAARPGLKQETIAIVAVGVTILGTMLYTTSRLEARMAAPWLKFGLKLEQTASS